MIGLTDRQAEVLRLICSFLMENLRPPTYREIGARLSVRSVYTVACHLLALEKKGFIRRDRYTEKGIVVLMDDAGRRPVLRFEG